jgi:hypothetical protein
MTDDELFERVVVPGMRRLKMKELFRRAAEGEGRIVCTGDLTVHQIAEARAEGRMWVDATNLGWVLLPWGLTTAKDRARGAQAERDRCQRVAQSVVDSALRFRNVCPEGSSEWETWDTRVRAASDILTSIRAGVEPR